MKGAHVARIALLGMLVCPSFASASGGETGLPPPHVFPIPGVTAEQARRIEDADRLRLHIQGSGAQTRVPITPVWQEWMVRGDSLVIEDRFLTHRLAVEGRIARIELPAGRRTEAGARRGLVMGTLAGVIGAPMIIYRTVTNSWHDNDCGDFPCFEGDLLRDWGVSIMMGAGIGAAVGALAGSLSERWEGVYPQPAREPPAP